MCTLACTDTYTHAHVHTRADMPRYIHTYIPTYTHKCRHIQTDTCIHTHIHPSIHPSVRPSIHACMHACMHVGTDACNMYKMYIYICICIYIYMDTEEMAVVPALLQPTIFSGFVCFSLYIYTHIYIHTIHTKHTYTHTSMIIHACIPTTHIHAYIRLCTCIHTWSLGRWAAFKLCFASQTLRLAPNLKGKP